MAPIVKDSDAAVSTATPNSQAAPAAKPPGDAPARVQPVALEVPVSINGARTIEGSDKREPFSESTQTVLVFPQGAVIRLAASLAPGQLVFLTNEKTKKEVVCQVVKSKNYRTVTGYVELEFTEAAAGFWGMRFPTAPSAGAPTGPRPAATPTAVAPTTPKPPAQPTQNAVPAKPVAPSAPVTKPEAQSIPVAPKPIAPPPAPPRPAALPQAPQSQTSTPATNPVARQIPPIVAPPREPKIESKSQVPAVSNAPVAPPLPLPAIPDLSDFLTAAPGSAVPVKPEKPEQPSIASTEELKQQAAKLQEQLSAMLFAEKPEPHAPASVAPPAAEKKPATPETVSKVLELADLAPKRPAAAAPPAPISKVTPIVHKPATTSSFDSEQVQIPAWLAPLANNSETKSPASSVTNESTALTEPATSEIHQDESAGLSSSENSSHSIQSEMFGGQLLDDSSASSASDGSGKSKRGLFIGVAAGLLIAGGAFWYSQQPGNVLTGKSAAMTATTTPAAPASTPFAGESVAKPQSSLPAPSNAPNSSAAASPSLTAAKQTTLSESNPPASSTTLTPAASKQPSERTRTVAAEPSPAPEPKKPVVGNVQLAKPVVNGGAATHENGESSLSIDVNQPTNGESLSSLESGHSKGPAAPLPVGGDVKPAQLLKSVPPVYPTMAKTQHISGSVKIDALIDASGNVSSVAVISGPAMLHQAALTAVKQWRYQPAELDGKPTSMHLTVTVQFRLQ
jgi:TonB family protein